MAFFLFLDESGHDWRQTPYEVLCGLAVEDRALWPFLSQVRVLEYETFGMNLQPARGRIKGSQMLSRKVFRHAYQMSAFDSFERRRLSKECLEHPEAATREHLTALAQAKIVFVSRLLELCLNFNLRIFATFKSEPGELDLHQPMLDKNYVYLFERFYYFLEEQFKPANGIVVYDDVSRSRSHLMIHQMENYFKKTEKGRERAQLIVPEPFFVQSDLAIGIQVTDILAYLMNWAFRLPTMSQPVREELLGYAEMIKPLRYRTLRQIPGLGKMEIWSVVAIR